MNIEAAPKTAAGFAEFAHEAFIFLSSRGIWEKD
jgi:hypothetical protein